MGCKLKPVFLVFLIVSLVFSGFQIREVKAPSTFGSVETPDATSTIEDKVTGDEFACPEIGTADSITAYLNSYGNTRTVKCTLYHASDNSLVTNGVSEEKNVNPDGLTAITFNFDAPKPSLTAQNYILVAWSNGSIFLGLKYLGGDAGSLKDDEVYDGFPATFADELDVDDKEGCLYVTYTPGAGQDLAFNLIENFNVWASTTKSIETSNTFYQNFNTWETIAFNKEIGFKLYEPFNLWSYLASSKEQGFTFFQPFNLWSSLSHATEGVALDLYFTLFEGFNTWASITTDITTEVTLEDVQALAALGFIMAIVAICLAVAYKKG